MPRVLTWTGGGFLLVVVLTHIAERCQVLPGMGWGLPNSPGHYLDLFSAVAGIALLVGVHVTHKSSNRTARPAKPSGPREHK